MALNIRFLGGLALAAMLLAGTASAQAVNTNTEGTVFGFPPITQDQAAQSVPDGADKPLPVNDRAAAGFGLGAPEMTQGFQTAYQQNPGNIWNPSFMGPHVMQQFEDKKASGFSATNNTKAATESFQNFAASQEPKAGGGGDMSIAEIIAMVFAGAAMSTQM